MVLLSGYANLLKQLTSEMDHDTGSRTVCQDVSQAKDMLEREVHEALGELSTTKMDSSELRKLVEARRLDDEPSKPTAKTDSKRIGRRKQDSKPGVKRRTRKVANRKG